jgi:hypothetical protein
MIDWNATKLTETETMTVRAIIDRAQQLGVERSCMHLMMDVQAAHHACPMDLEALMQAANTDFLHDVYGISANLNRETGELENGFLPRFARR